MGYVFIMHNDNKTELGFLTKIQKQANYSYENENKSSIGIKINVA
jgi:hypothetical protein